MDIPTLPTRPTPPAARTGHVSSSGGALERARAAKNVKPDFNPFFDVNSVVAEDEFDDPRLRL